MVNIPSGLTEVIHQLQQVPHPNGDATYDTYMMMEKGR